MSVRAILVTPNLLGTDGVSCLSRQVLRVLPRPSVVLSLHDHPASDNGLPRTILAAGGNPSRFLSHAAHLALEAARDTTVVCTHLHLSAVARAVAWRGWRVRPVTHVLCGIEAWVRLRLTERWA